jgi:hypothetical protein
MLSHRRRGALREAAHFTAGGTTGTFSPPRQLASVSFAPTFGGARISAPGPATEKI